LNRKKKEYLYLIYSLSTELFLDVEPEVRTTKTVKGGTQTGGCVQSSSEGVGNLAVEPVNVDAEDQVISVRQ
jgi:hypothetical protein